MAIRKTEIRLTQKELEQVKKHEKQIDRFLKKEYVGQKEVFYLEGRISERALNELIERYKQAGWKIKYFYHKLEGEMLEFS